MFIGRGITLVLSIAGLVLFPRILGPKAHGSFQYYLSLQLFLLGFINGCAAPMATHYVALYRVSNPPRQGALLTQLFYWYGCLLLLIGGGYFFLRDPTGYGWVFLAVAFSGLSQLVSSAIYGLGRLGPITWFPVLNGLLRIVLICGIGWYVQSSSTEEALHDWGRYRLPIFLFLATVPSTVWMLLLFVAMKAEWFHGEATRAERRGAALLPWAEIKTFGVAAMLGQIIYQTFTRTLPVLAKQFGYPEEEVGYLGLATQAFGQVIFVAGIFSVTVYPWLVGSFKGGDHARFARLQSEAWRMCAVTGIYLAAAVFVLIRPVIWLLLGEKYHPDADLLAAVCRVGALGGVFMLAGDFHLRMLVSRTEMKRYLTAIGLGFPLVIPYVVWVAWTNQGIVWLTGTLPLGVLLVAMFATWLAPRTERFWKVNGLCVAGAFVAGAASYPFAGGSEPTWTGLALQGCALTLVYGGWAWMVGLIGLDDLSRLRRSKKNDSPDEAP